MRRLSAGQAPSGVILRSSSLKPALKEKFVSLYEGIFEERSILQTAKDQGISGRAALGRFWDELLLLKVNEAYLAQCVARIPEDKLMGSLKQTMNTLFSTCVRYLGDDNFIRVAHALETLGVLLREIFKKRFSEQGFAIISLVAGSVDHADAFFKRMICDVAGLLMRDDAPALVKALGLRLYLVILTATGNVNTNSIASYLFLNNIFDAIVATLTIKIPSDRSRLELDASLVLLLLLLYRESPNPYLQRLSLPGAPLSSILHTTASLLAKSNQKTRPLSSFPSFASPTPSFSPSPSFSTLVRSPSPSSPSSFSLFSKEEGGGNGFIDPSNAAEMLSALSSTAGATVAAVGAGVVSLVGHAMRLAGREGLPPAGASRESGSSATSAEAGPSAQNGLGGGGGGGGGPGGMVRSSYSEGLDPALDVGWCNGAAATLLIYFMVYLNPLMKSSQVWPPGGFVNAELAGQGTALAILWGDVFRAFLGLCKSAFSQADHAGSAAGLRAKICLIAFRCLLEDIVSSEFLFAAPSPAPVSASSPRTRPQSCMLVDMAVKVLLLPPPLAGHFDAELYMRAAVIVPIVLNYAKSKGRPLPANALDWRSLWRGLINTCEMCSPKTAFQRPGVAELADLTVAIVEACVGGGTDMIGATDEVERLHAVVLRHIDVFESLSATASASGYGETARASVAGGIRLVNITSVKSHYEVQLAAMGIRGQPTEQQALAAVKKKGLANLKLKARHAGPGTSYMEGTGELRLLNSLVKLLVSEHRRHFWASMPKFELETM